MSGQNAEIQHLKANVSCSVLLERLPPVWRLDRAESTRRCLKYRRGVGEIVIVIVNHDGRGWGDPLSEAKGDIFSLVQHLEPGLNFAEARHMLRGLVGGDRADVSGGPQRPPRACTARTCPPAVDPIRTMNSRSRRRYSEPPAPACPRARHRTSPTRRMPIARTQRATGIPALVQASRHIVSD